MGRLTVSGWRVCEGSDALKSMLVRQQKSNSACPAAWKSNSACPAAPPRPPSVTSQQQAQAGRDCSRLGCWKHLIPVHAGSHPVAVVQHQQPGFSPRACLCRPFVRTHQSCTFPTIHSPTMFGRSSDLQTMLGVCSWARADAAQVAGALG